MRIANPKPGFCSVCYGAHPDRRYVDCEADFDGAPVLDRETNTIAVLPWNGELAAHDNICICEACAENIRTILGQEKYSDTIRKQVREIQKLEIQVEHWKDTAKRFRDEAERQMGANLGEDAPKRVRRAA